MRAIDWLTDLPHFKSTGKSDGRVKINVRVYPDLVQRVNAGFRGQWRNAPNIGKPETEIEYVGHMN